MRHTIDEKRYGHAMIFDGPADLLNSMTWLTPREKKQIASWIYKAKEADVAMVRKMADHIKEAPLPEGISRKRRMHFTETDGEICIDRYMRGNNECYRRAHRPRTNGPGNVTILANLDGFWSNTHNEIFYRGAMTIALCELLEENGYTTEVIAWNTGKNVYAYPHDRQFTACRIKEAANSLDISSLIGCLGQDYMHLLFHSFKCAGDLYRNVGTMTHHFDTWKHYLDIDPQETVTLSMPISFNEGDVIQKTHDMLKKVIAAQQ